MSTYCAQPLGDRIMIIHDMASETIFSELDVEQAELLMRQLQAALLTAISAARTFTFVPV